MAEIETVFSGVTPTAFGSALKQIMDAEDIRPGDAVSYEICKALWLYHPLGNVMCEKPVKLAQSKSREITVPGAPEADVVKAFNDEWKACGADATILSVGTQARAYGLASVGMGIEGQDQSKPIAFDALADKKPFFNTFDPLNTAGLIVDQNPNSPDFQKFSHLTVAGVPWHRSRTVTLQNEAPVYIAWTTSAFAFSGRSVFQRSLYPLRSFLNSMITDDMVMRKAGVLVAKMQSHSSVVDRMMMGLFRIKRQLLRDAKTDNVLGISTEESIESLNLNNIDGAVAMCRGNIIKNIATGADMPAKLLTQEAYVEGFGEGTEDARAVVQYVTWVREWLDPLYRWFDRIVQYRAWTREFYETIQNKYPEEYKNVTYEEAFYRWCNRFETSWPNLIEEPESALVQVDQVKLQGVIAILQVMGPLLAGQPDFMAELIEWAQSQINSTEHLFAGGHLALDTEKLAEDMAKEKVDQEDQHQLMMEERDKPPPAFSGRDSIAATALADFTKFRRSKRVSM